MSELTQKYVRRPLYVDAVEVTDDNFEAIAEWCQGEIRTISDDKPVAQEVLDVAGTDDLEKMYIYVRVHHPKTPRQTHAKIGDWILYAAEQKGYKVYTPKAFETNFDQVEEEGVDKNEDVEPEPNAAEEESE